MRSRRIRRAPSVKRISVTCSISRTTSTWRRSGTSWRSPRARTGFAHTAASASWPRRWGSSTSRRTHLRFALERRPTTRTWSRPWRSRCSKQGRPADAIPLLHRAIRIEPGYFHGHAHLGAAYMQAGQPDKALTHLERAIALRPQRPRRPSHRDGNLPGGQSARRCRRRVRRLPPAEPAPPAAMSGASSSAGETLALAVGAPAADRPVPAARLARLTWMPTVLAVITVAVFAPALLNGFVDWDDSINVIGEHPLSRARLDSAPVDVHHDAHGPLHPRDVAHARPRLHALGHEPVRLPPVEHPLRMPRTSGCSISSRSGCSGGRPASPGPRCDWPAPSRRCSSPCTRSARSPSAWVDRAARRPVGLLFLLTVLLYLASIDADGPATSPIASPHPSRATRSALLSKSIVMTLPLMLVVLDIYPLRPHLVRAGHGGGRRPRARC